MSAVRSLFDEDFNARIVRGILRRRPLLDAVTVRAAGLQHAPDAAVLDWAAAQGRVVISHDHNTMRACAEERNLAGLAMSGLILVRQNYPIGRATDDLALISEASSREEWAGRVIFLPL